MFTRARGGGMSINSRHNCGSVQEEYWLFCEKTMVRMLCHMSDGEKSKSKCTILLFFHNELHDLSLET